MNYEGLMRERLKAEAAKKEPTQVERANHLRRVIGGPYHRLRERLAPHGVRFGHITTGATPSSVQVFVASELRDNLRSDNAAHVEAVLVRAATELRKLLGGSDD